MKKKNSILETITILITTYKRHDYLKRLLSFFLNFDYKISILILDSTPYIIEDKVLLELLNTNNNIKLLTFNSEMPVYEKIYQGSQYINTKYSVLCADDDFIFPSTIIKCIEFLENNKDFTSCHGIYCHYNYNYNIKFLRLFNFNNLRLNSIYNKPGGEESSFEERVTNYLNGNINYYPFYAVHNTLDFKKIWMYTSKFSTNSSYAEIFSTMASLIFGKMKILNKIYGIREMNSYIWYDLPRLKNMYNDENTFNILNGIIEILNYKNYNNIEEFKINLINLLISKRNKTINKFVLNNKNTFPQKKLYNYLQIFLKIPLFFYREVIMKPKALKLIFDEEKIFREHTLHFKSNNINLSRNDF